MSAMHRDACPVCGRESAAEMFPRYRETLTTLTFMARTSGGTTLTDDALMRACEAAEALIGKVPLCATRKPEDRNRIDRAALSAAPELAGAKAIVLYFATDAARDRFARLAEGSMASVRVVNLN